MYHLRIKLISFPTDMHNYCPTGGCTGLTAVGIQASERPTSCFSPNRSNSADKRVWQSNSAIDGESIIMIYYRFLKIIIIASYLNNNYYINY